MQIIVKNGIVIDPINNVKGEVMDIAVKDGRIVDPSEIDASRAVTIDAKNKLVMAGGIDIHSHIAGSKVNIGRLMRPEDHYLTNKPHSLPYRRAETGLTVPNVYKIGYGYARLGYTFVVEPATPPIKTRHTHHELNAIPLIDKAAYVLVDSNWITLDFIKEGDKEFLASYLAWLLIATKTYALKLVDPGSDYVWLLKGEGIDVDDQIPGYGLTPGDIIRSVAEASQILGLPHKVHIHCNRLGYPGNYATTLKTMGLAEAVPKLAPGYAMHITHVQFTGYKGDSWATLESGGEDIAKELNRNPYISLDLGQVIPGRPATTMTADAPFEFVLYHLARWKWSSIDTEVDAAAGIVPYKYKKKSYVNTIQWVIGLEITLLANDPWRVFITTDHPNAGTFYDYPKIFAWLVSKKAREDIMKEMNQRALKKSALPAIDKEYTLYDLAVMTRASPAKLLGLEQFKGNLGIGADADIAIYDINPFELDISKNYEALIKAFSRASTVIKGGEIVVKDGEVVKTVYGKIFYVKPEVPEDLEKNLTKALEAKFKEYYTVTLENFVIKTHEVRNLAEIRLRTLFNR
ncbi:MAG: formylmethanofuran dehydrogenase subunit A [Ignisphaera sp.]|uniref:Formylmethanofuran dehydrogenase subunit A n=1 Tax=Ignisphaera aggregans TaxID=334771 RepID=A0A7C4JK98_9CREN